MRFTPERRGPVFPAVRCDSFHKETRMKTLVWAGILYLPFLDLFWWLR